MTFSRLAKHYRAISNTVSFLRVFQGGGIFYSKEEDGLTSYFILDVLEAKIFRYKFMEGHNV